MKKKLLLCLFCFFVGLTAYGNKEVLSQRDYSLLTINSLPIYFSSMSSKLATKEQEKEKRKDKIENAFFPVFIVSGSWFFSFREFSVFNESVKRSRLNSKTDVIETNFNSEIDSNEPEYKLWGWDVMAALRLFPWLALGAGFGSDAVKAKLTFKGKKSETYMSDLYTWAEHSAKYIFYYENNIAGPKGYLKAILPLYRSGQYRRGMFGPYIKYDVLFSWPEEIKYGIMKPVFPESYSSDSEPDIHYAYTKEYSHDIDFVVVSNIAAGLTMELACLGLYVEYAYKFYSKNVLPDKEFYFVDKKSGYGSHIQFKEKLNNGYGIRAGLFIRI